MIDRIEKSFSKNVTGPKQYQTRRFSTTISAPVPELAKQATPEGKKAFIEFSDKLEKILEALVNRDAQAAENEVAQAG
jgi:hypothetical protein